MSLGLIAWQGLQTVLDLKKALEQAVIDLPTAQQKLTLLRTDKRRVCRETRNMVDVLARSFFLSPRPGVYRLEPESQQLSAFGLKDGDELASWLSV